MRAEKLRLAVFVSGGGSNLQAILDACARPDFPAETAVVVSNDPQAHGLDRARAASVEALAIPQGGFASRQEHEREILRQIEAHGASVGVLAGYMRLVTPLLIEHFRNPKSGLPGLLNIHPADTRAYQGAHGYEFAMGLLPEYPERLSQTAISVHFVDAGMDTGPIIKQVSVPIEPSDSVDELRARGLAIEHKLYPEVIRLLAEGRIRLKDGLVHIE